jgi:hypothetical protein
MLAGHLDMAELAFIGVALLVASRTLEVALQFFCARETSAWEIM